MDSTRPLRLPVVHASKMWQRSTSYRCSIRYEQFRGLVTFLKSFLNSVIKNGCTMSTNSWNSCCIGRWHASNWWFHMNGFPAEHCPEHSLTPLKFPLRAHPGSNSLMSTWLRRTFSFDCLLLLQSPAQVLIVGWTWVSMGTLIGPRLCRPTLSVMHMLYTFIIVCSSPSVSSDHRICQWDSLHVPHKRAQHSFVGLCLSQSQFNFIYTHSSERLNAVSAAHGKLKR